MNKIIFTVFITFLSVSAMAGFQPGLTRVIYDESKGETSIPVNAVKDNSYYLVQSWVEDVNHQRANFMLSPPIFKLAPNTQNTIRIKYIGEPLANDRETLFFLNIKAIPSKDSAIKNQITIASKSVLKLMYRPKSLDYKSAIQAKSSLDFSWQEGKLRIKNPTAYYVNFGRFFAGTTELKGLSYVAPFSEVVKEIEHNPVSVRYNVIDDFGGVTDFITVNNI